MKQEKACLNCGRSHTGKGGYCSYKCGVEAMFDANDQIKRKDGPIYEKWKARWEAATGLKMKGGD